MHYVVGYQQKATSQHCEYQLYNFSNPIDEVPLSVTEAPHVFILRQCLNYRIMALNIDLVKQINLLATLQILRWSINFLHLN